MRNFSAFGITFSHFGGIKPQTPLQKAVLRPQKCPLAETFPPKAVLQLARSLYQRRVGRNGFLWQFYGFLSLIPALRVPQSCKSRSRQQP